MRHIHPAYEFCKLSKILMFILLFHLVLMLICSPLVSSSLTENITTDESSLVALKSHFILDPNSKVLLENWNSNVSVCNWIGVKCSPVHKRVVALNISSSGLGGTIPPQIGNLSFLNYIDISNNNFQGKLPEEIVHLTRLKYIDLSINSFSGEVPSSFGSLPDLQYLNLANNSFAGNLPSSLFNATKLVELGLDFNLLEGNIPQEIGNLANLKLLYMQENQLSGSLPLSIFNLSSLQIMGFSFNGLSGNLPLNICSNLPKLIGLHLSGNQLSGQVQSRFNNCSELQILSLSINKFNGPLPTEIGNLTKLRELYCGFNNFQGEIPTGLGNLLNLEVLQIVESSLNGPIPEEIGNLHKLTVLELASNALSGPIPSSIFNISSLSIISFSINNLSGSLPLSIGQQLPNLEVLLLGGNKLNGVVLDSISNFTKLTNLELGNNQFSGLIPSSLGNLRLLKVFGIAGNLFTSDPSPELSFLASLTNCTSLRLLHISENPLNGILPTTIGNFSSSLESFYASSCGFEGNIPHEIGNLSGLSTLSLENNNFSGQLPMTFQRLSKLQALDLRGNKIAGFLPDCFCSLRYLAILQLSENQLSGQVPECFGNITSLRNLYLHSNSLNSTLPATFWSLKDLLFFDIHSNSLSGYITPEIGNLKRAVFIDLSHNEFSGKIPTSIGGFQNMIICSLADNQFEGPIPETFGNMLSLEHLDLSFNNLSGEIPTSLESLLYLKYFNVSFNHLQGKVPTNGSFRNFTNESFMSNEALCGGPPHLQFPPCPSNSLEGSRTKKLLIVAYILMPSAFVSLVISILLVFLKKQKDSRSLAQVNLVPSVMHERVSYYELQKATNGFSKNNLLGVGSYGSVYRGIQRDGQNIAVKVFNLQLEGAFKSFDMECQVLCNLRHRNLVKLISSCTNLEFRGLVLEYMPNGSLEEWLHSHTYFLDFLQRLSIMIDVASALDYLHHGVLPAVVHCDLKPSNVLLDQDMTGHVSDFGISKLFGGDQGMAQTKTLATIGYMAPEYGSQGIVSTRCDLYSFGILLMETFSRKKPTDEVFAGDCGLKEWVMTALKSSAHHFIDQNLLTPEGQNSKIKMQCISSVMELALRCTVDSPEKRINASDALQELKKIRMLFLSNETSKELAEDERNFKEPSSGVGCSDPRNPNFVNSCTFSCIMNATTRTKFYHERIAAAQNGLRAAPAIAKTE